MPARTCRSSSSPPRARRSTGSSAWSSAQTTTSIKPFGFRELLARIRAVLRRTHRGADDTRLRAGSLELDLRSRRATLDGGELALTPKEFDLLALLASDPGAVVSRDHMLREVWNTEWFGPTKTIDVHVASLRKKLGDPRWIETVRGVGLRLAPQP